jgi:ectoine hydroxylase-related dioxygenase (phytanoyl-CoA dioxygenase family)
MFLLDHKAIRFLASLRFPKSEIESDHFPVSARLTSEEKVFFIVNGYLVRSAVINPQVLDRAVKYAWSQLPESFHPDNAATWKGKITDSLCTRSIDARKGRVKLRECVRRERWLYDMIAANPCIQSTVQELIGQERIAPLRYVRGIYPIFPSKIASLKRARPHTDGHHFLVGTLTYLTNVEPGGGGFTVWPGSHLVMRSGFTYEAGPAWEPTYHRELYGYALRNSPVEIVGSPGTVIFWHHRLAHAAGFNRSSNIRLALLADFHSTDIDHLESIPAGNEPWAHWKIGLASEHEPSLATSAPLAFSAP